MKHFNHTLLIIVASLLLFGSCDKETLENYESYGWEPEYLGPLLYSEVDYSDFEDLIFTQSTYSFNSGTANLPVSLGIPVPVPTIPKQPKFPSEYFSFTSYARSIGVDSLELFLEFTNPFNVPIGEETRIVARDSANTQQVLFDHATTREVGPDDTYTFSVVKEDFEIGNTIEIYVEDFNSPGSDGAFVEVNSEQELNIILNIQILDIKEVEVENSIEYGFSGTSPFEVDITEQDRGAYEGDLYLFLDNGFPMDISLRVAFLNAADDTIFEFFPERLDIERAPVDAAGNVTDINYMDPPQTYKIEDIPNLGDATRLYFETRFATRPSPEVVIFTDETKMILQITSRLKITPSRINN